MPRQPLNQTGGSLELDGLSVSFGSVSVLRNLSMHAEPGEIVGLFGRNGAGKTTTLRAISGLNPRTGFIRYQGVNLPVSAAEVARRGIAHVPEGRQLMGDFTVSDNLKFACAAVGKRFDSHTLNSLLASFSNLERVLHRRAGLLSGGEQQMVAIARGLAVEPSILLVDELSLGLSPRAVQESLTALVQACRTRRTTLILVDQNVRTVMKVCDRAYVLSNGQTAEVAHNAEDRESVVAAAYLGAGEDSVDVQNL
jgi:branched-chain amino acid transport system ATP-binding protein